MHRINNLVSVMQSILQFARGMKFIPEERAKKLSFDRMIFKLEPTEETLKVWDHDFEYRFDITLVSSQMLECVLLRH